MRKLILFLAVAILYSGINLNAQTIQGAKKSSSKEKTEAPAAKVVEKKAETKTEAKKEASKKAVKPIKGYVASLNAIATGGDGRVKKDEAQALAEKGSPVVFVVGSGKSAKVYFVYNSDGTFAGKNLAKYASNKFVGIKGKTKVVNGVNIIIADMIESFD